MIDKQIILKTLDDAIIKCGPTIAQRIANFNPKDFKSERYSKKEGQIRSADRSPVGPLQQLQEDLQSEINYTNEEKAMLSEYTVDFWPFSAYFYHKGLFINHEGTGWMLSCYKWNEREWDENRRRVLKEPNELIDFDVFDFTNFDAQEGRYPDGSFQTPDKAIKKLSFMEGIETLDNMIEKSPPLQENTILYRVGSFDINLRTGDTGKWKNYTSTTFNSYQAKSGLKKVLGTAGNPDNYQLKIYAPAGTKGVVPCQNTGCNDWQSEFTLGRNQKYIVISVDHYNKTAEILLY